MVKYILIIGFYIIFGRIHAQNTDPGFNKTILHQNDDIEVFISCSDTAGIDREDWLKFIIKNKTAFPIIINAAKYSINEAPQTATTGLGRYGTGNQYQLFHYYHNYPSNQKNYFEIPPHSELSSWKMLTNTTSVMVELRHGDRNDICPFFQSSVSYTINEKPVALTNAGISFCFYWKSYEQMSKENLTARLRTALEDVRIHPVNSDVITYLFNKPELREMVSSNEMVNVVLKKNNLRANDIDILLLNELKSRNKLPDIKLTENYSALLKHGVQEYPGQLIYYWDNALLDDLLQSNLPKWHIEMVLEANAPIWAAEAKNTAMVYEYLTAQTGFNTNLMPGKKNFKAWYAAVKSVSMSRDRRIVDYLVPFLDNEKACKIEDVSGSMGTRFRPKQKKPVFVEIRVCDVAFVALLKASGQTNYNLETPGLYEEIPLGLASYDKQGNLVHLQEIWGPLSIKPDLLDPEQRTADLFEIKLYMAEKKIKLTPESKKRIMEYLKLI